MGGCVALFLILVAFWPTNLLSAPTLVDPIPAPKVLPKGFALPPVKEYPFLFFGPHEKSSIAARVKDLPDPGEATRYGVYLFGDEAARRQATEDFRTGWRSYSNKKWTRGADFTRDDPDGVALRGVRRTLEDYELVKTYGFLAVDEERSYRDSLHGILLLALGSDPEKPRVTRNAGFRTMNIWSDVVCAGGLFGLFFPEVPQARAWVELAADELGWQWSRVVWDGAWHECPRYHMAMLTIAGTFYSALLHRTGIDLFQDSNWKSLLEWPVRFSTPMDKVFGSFLGRPEGVILIPGIGDTSWDPGPLGLLAEWAPRYRESDPALAARLMWAWHEAGRPVRNLEVEAAQALIDPGIKPIPPKLGSDLSPGKGHMVMRGGQGPGDERWMILRCGRATRAGHDHGDWNAFNIHAFGYPLALDAGSGNYGHPTHKAWHDKSIAHNTVVFGERSQERRDGEILSWASTPAADWSASDASAAAKVPRFHRRVLFVKPDYWVVWDELRGEEPTRFMVHTTATNLEWGKHQVRCWTPWGVGLDVHVAWPNADLVPGTEKGRFGDWIPGEGGAEPKVKQPFYFQEYFGISNQANGDFLVVLRPVRKGEAPLTVIDKGQPGKPKLEIRQGTQVDTVTLNETGAILHREGPIAGHHEILGVKPEVPPMLSIGIP